MVAIANLTECWPSLGEGCLSSPQKDSFGWFESGRYAWEMADVKQIDPVPV